MPSEVPGRSSGGVSVAQRSPCPTGQRGSKEQPAGGARGSAAAPGSSRAGPRRGGRAAGTERTRAFVYGVQVMNNPPSWPERSTIRPAYMTQDAPQNSATMPRLCVIRITAIRARTGRSARSRTCACVVTSSGRRLVRDDDVRLVRERDGDHHPLAHAARVLVRVVVEPLLGGNLDLAQKLDGLRPSPR